MNVDHDQLGHSEAPPDGTPSDDEIEGYVTRFRAALALAHTDPAEAARIDSLVAELDADEFLYAEAMVTIQELRPRRNRGRRFQLKLPGSQAAVVLDYGRWESGTNTNKQEPINLKKKTKNQVH